ncbi:LutC/YkgG family protein [Corynebacterium bovis]|uniref:LutC/YkgG family protein n=1 Tax=Corynebacterium bovis TaxID=36808 RepID=UPI003CC6F174
MSGRTDSGRGAGTGAGAGAGAGAKEVILARVRDALGRGDDATPPPAGDIPREYRRSGTLTGDELVDLFIDRLEDYDATVRRVPADGVAGAVAAFLRERHGGGDAAREDGGGAGEVTVVTPDAVPAEWFAEVTGDDDGDGDGAAPAEDGPADGDGFSVRVIRDSRERPLGVDTVNSVDAVVTGSAVSVADTGTIVLVGELSGRRATTLVPDHHIVVVDVADIVEIVPEAFRRLTGQGLDGQPMTFVSGPSATVDIELIRVQGVHGPRTLDVVIAG